MTERDPNICRRALREIAEIAAVSVLEDSQMTDQEALQTIAAIAEWVDEEAPGARADCGDVIRRINAMTGSADFEEMDDREALRLFGRVLDILSPGRAGDESGAPCGGNAAPPTQLLSAAD